MTSARRPIAAVLLAASSVAWLFTVLLYLAYLAGRRVWVGVAGCSSPAGSASDGTASWHWWYPGTRCTYGAARTPSGTLIAAHVDDPSRCSGLVVVVLLLWPVATLLAHRATARTRATVA